MHYEDDSLISYKQENPKKQPSKAYHRYEKYKSAKTIKEARELGAGIHDFRHDHSKGFMTVKDARGNVIQPPVPVKKELEEEPEAAEENPVPEQPGNLPCPAAKAKAAAKAANKRKSIASGSSHGKQPKIAGVGAPPELRQGFCGGLLPDSGEIPSAILRGKGGIPAGIPDAIPGRKGGCPVGIPSKHLDKVYDVQIKFANMLHEISRERDAWCKRAQTQSSSTSRLMGCIADYMKNVILNGDVTKLHALPDNVQECLQRLQRWQEDDSKNAYNAYKDRAEAIGVCDTSFNRVLSDLTKSFKINARALKIKETTSLGGCMGTVTPSDNSGSEEYIDSDSDESVLNRTEDSPTACSEKDPRKQAGKRRKVEKAASDDAASLSAETQSAGLVPASRVTMGTVTHESLSEGMVMSVVQDDGADDAARCSELQQLLDTANAQIEVLRRQLAESSSQPSLPALPAWRDPGRRKISLSDLYA